MPASNLCPYCTRPMSVTRMACNACHVAVEGDFPAPRLANIPIEHQRFIEIFVLAGGNLKQIAEQAGVSYPTVRSRLDKVIASLGEAIATTQGSTRSDGDRSATVSRGDDTAQIIKSV